MRTRGSGDMGCFSVTVLAGAIVLEDLDFLVDCITQTLRPRDPRRIVAEVE